MTESSPSDDKSEKILREMFVATYIYECDDCAGIFEIVTPMGTAPKNPQCVKCNSGKTGRNFALENKHFIPPAQTIGSLADKNGAKLSRDERKEIEHKNVYGKFREDKQ